MGRVRTNLVKKASKQIIEKYYSRLTLDFDTNKKLVDEVATLPSKRVRNKISGFSTHLMKRIQRGPVRGISLKLQEEERERRMDFVPERSILDVDRVDIDDDTQNMLRSIDFRDLPGVHVGNTEYPYRPGRGGQDRQGQQGQRKQRGQGQQGQRQRGTRGNNRKQQKDQKEQPQQVEAPVAAESSA